VIKDLLKVKYIKNNPLPLHDETAWARDTILGCLACVLHTQPLFDSVPWWPSTQFERKTKLKATLLIIGLINCWTTFHLDRTEAVTVAIALVRRRVCDVLLPRPTCTLRFVLPAAFACSVRSILRLLNPGGDAPACALPVRTYVQAVAPCYKNPPVSRVSL
jgi:hypothetical protein